MLLGFGLVAFAVLQQRPFCSFKLIYHCHYHVLISGSYDRMRLFAKIVEA